MMKPGGICVRVRVQNDAQTDFKSDYNKQGKPTTAFDLLRACDNVIASEKRSYLQKLED